MLFFLDILLFHCFCYLLYLFYTFLEVSLVTSQMLLFNCWYLCKVILLAASGFHSLLLGGHQQQVPILPWDVLRQHRAMWDLGDVWGPQPHAASLCRGGRLSLLCWVYFGHVDIKLVLLGLGALEVLVKGAHINLDVARTESRHQGRQLVTYTLFSLCQWLSFCSWAKSLMFFEHTPSQRACFSVLNANGFLYFLPSPISPSPSEHLVVPEDRKWTTQVRAGRWGLNEES